MLILYWDAIFREYLDSILMINNKITKIKKGDPSFFLWSIDYSVLDSREKRLSSLRVGASLKPTIEAITATSVGEVAVV